MRSSPPAELFRALGTLCEGPGPEARRLAELLDLGELPGEAEHNDLFLFQLYPYASVYLDEEGMLGGEARDRIAGFWRALGQEPPKDCDHLALLLAFYAELCELEAREAESENGSPGRWARARLAFLHEHLLSWLPVYLAKLQECATDFWSGWGTLLAATLIEEARRGEVPPSLPLHLRLAESLDDPSLEGMEPFLASLLSPVRSGLILVRSDLVRAARQLELGGRIGERRFVLRALLAQEASAMLGWLGEEARRSAVRHGKVVPPQVAAFWSARATASADLLERLASSATLV